MTKPIRLLDSSGEIAARDNLLLVFFGKSTFSDMVEGAKHVFDRYLGLVPGGALQWSIIGMSAEIHKPVNKPALNRCRSMLKMETTKKKDTHFRLMGPQKYGADYYLTVMGYKQPEKAGFLDQTNLVELRFPREFLADYGEGKFVELTQELFAVLPCDSGYASIALCYSEGPAEKSAGALIAPLALRSHGFDVPDNLSTSSSMGGHCRGARWLTMLSSDLVGQVGGLKALEQKLPKTVLVHGSAKGVMLQAGKAPEIGDVNQNDRTPLLRSVAHAIEKITYFDDNSLLPIFGNDPERRNRWERRFWTT